MTCRFAHSDGAYVLGALSPSERLEFERHLPLCAECSRSVRELAGLPGLLAQVSLDDLDPARQPPLPRTLPSALSADIRRSQRRRTLAAAGIAAAIAGLVSAAAVGLSVREWGSAPGTPVASTSVTSTTPALPMTAVGHVPVQASVRLEPVPWGTRLDVTCTYEGGPGYTRPADYALVVRTRSGGSEQVATWRGLPGKTMNLSAATATARRDITSVEMRTRTGTTVLRLVI